MTDCDVEPWRTGRPHEGKVFAAVFPHSDDLAIFAGGTVMKLLAEGYTGYFVKLTNDEKDSHDLSIGETIHRIEVETQRVADALGLAKVYCFNYKNHYLEHSQLVEIRHRLIVLFRFLRVDTVLSFDPWGHYEENPDHYLTGMAVEAACWMSGRRLDLPELADLGLTPKPVTEKYYVARGPQLRNRAVDVTDVRTAKRDTIAMHETPLRNMWYEQSQQHGDAALSTEAIVDTFVQLDEAGRHVEYFHHIGPEPKQPALGTEDG